MTNKDSWENPVSPTEMGAFIRQIDHPQLFAIVVLLAKTGIRLGELINLDLRDINLDHHRAQQLLSQPRTELEGKPDSLFVSSEITAGDVVNGDKRRQGTLRTRDTIIPLDDEAKQVLLDWLAIRPPCPTDATPLFNLTSDNATKKKTGERINGAVIRRMLQQETEPYGWYQNGKNGQPHVTPRYFRHLFSAYMRQRVDSAVVMYITGDKIDTILRGMAIQRCETNIRDEYLDSIYKFFE